MVSDPVRFPVAVGVNVTRRVHDDPAARELAQLLVWVKSPDIWAPLILTLELPGLDSVTDWAALELPTFVAEKTSDVGLKATDAATPVPLKLMTCGAPEASSLIVMDPVRKPAVVGVNVTESVQVPLAGTLVPQVLFCEKSPAAKMDETDSVVFPRFCKETCCGALVDPTVCAAKDSEVGAKETTGPELPPIFITNPSVLPPGAF
jgi:hypothetical protein